jgi:hypothetical protein
MDSKTLKSDLTYAIKKLTKEGKTLTLEWNPSNLQIPVNETFRDATTRRVEAGELTWEGSNFDALEALIFVKGLQYLPVKEVDDWTAPDGTRFHNEWFHHEAFGLPITDIVSSTAEIAKTDLYSFMDGLENVESANPKDPWYLVGVYIREKFTPVGARTEQLRRVEFVTPSTGTLTKKWIVHTRPMPGCKRGGPPTILEVECELLSTQDDSPGRVLKPEFLYEETRIIKDGVFKDVILPPVYMSHALFWTEHQAVARAAQTVKAELEFEVRKNKRESFTEQDVQDQVNLIQIVRLPP